MEAKTANETPLRDILNAYDRDVIRSYHGYDMYQSPFRTETHPSLQVKLNSNTWKDFGTGEFGSAVDLVMKLEGCSFLEAMQIFEAGKFGTGIRQSDPTPRKKEAEVKKVFISKLAPLQNKALLNYLKEQRGIEPDIAKRFCQEVYYKRDGNDKNLFAVAFLNDSGGMEYRNGAGYKGAFVNKDITSIDQGNDKCAVFEGFIDFLSYLQMTKGQPEKQGIDFVILNSVSMVEKAMPFLEKHQSAHCFLDNDPAGNKAFNRIKHSVPLAINESRFLYPDHKDLNEYWTDQLKKNLSEQPKMKGPKI